MSEPQNRTLTEQFMVRLPTGMRDRIKAAAEANNRSMNAEVVATLEEKYPSPKAPDLVDRLITLRGLIDDLGDNPELSGKMRWMHFAVLRSLMNELVEKMEAHDIERALDGWIQPVGWEEFDGMTQQRLSRIIHGLE